ncbi:MAG: sigma 54-interacting transcriptional regulator [Treponema sp.]|jgi:Nif-specific regulatory protein|nr:sigma 54-interacting transcriptional regulator [Treponema sp.]
MLSKINARKFNKLIEINTLINSNYQNLNVLLTHIVNSAMQLCDGLASSLLLTDEEKQTLYFEVALGSKGSAVKRFTVKIGEGIAGWVAQNQKSIIVNDVANDQRHLKNISRQIGYPVTTMLAVPMMTRDKCIGVVEVINKARGQFTQEDLEWLEVFSGQAALAIVNAKSFERAYSEIRQLHDRPSSDEGFHTMIGASPAIQDVLKMARRVAKTDSSVLILGESGAGKELIAEQIHLHSPRSAAPFVRVNCAALPEGLLESELFGHVKGAFTSAINNRKGRFEAADGGTIFLDEIGDMPLSLQAKLLRVIQKKTFEKVGSDVTVKVNTRILAATNRDIEGMVEKGEFRSDLYYRLNVLLLQIPPLRERAEDIPELARFFLAKCMEANKKQFEGFSENALEAMLTYSWPGNIRELENCVERACVISNGKWIRQEDLFPLAGSPQAGSLQTGGKSGHENRNLKTALNVFKANFVRKVLDENGWNQTDAARALDIQRTYLSKLIKDLHIKEEE